jgi:hypothetical protein
MKTITLVVLFAALLAGCATTSSRHPVAGTWDVESVSNMGTSRQTLMVNEDLTGMLQPAAGGPGIPLNNGSFEGGQLTFDVSFNIQGNALAAKFVGTIEGESITGEYRTAYGNGAVTGVRRADL